MVSSHPCAFSFSGMARRCRSRSSRGAARGRAAHQSRRSRRRAIARRCDYPEAWLNLSAALFRQRRFADAEAAARQALALRPGFPAALVTVADSLREQWRLQEAEAAYRRALEAAPKQWPALANFGWMLVQAGRMAHWRKVLPVPMLEIDYEAVVADQEGQSRRQIDWLGLDWSESCLSFFQTERLVRTASVTQVREPIYQRSVARWKRYEIVLAPLLEKLA
jgi:tetratricopeptide (TPR) repeat protein